jgi:hypothetical protein
MRAVDTTPYPVAGRSGGRREKEREEEFMKRLQDQMVD